ncbi:hypothetical protein GDO78_001832 [Eleutherodactylus coqui]|uniref:Uncharacterized protein n=1 Tax=Eleutherodactylus coqui TaxID=57060 RepID=A0A8J6FUY4_ELECQ|nr:hypothetical protein GDO78_001832 [Eleutherodactylus coqui]
MVIDYKFFVVSSCSCILFTLRYLLIRSRGWLEGSMTLRSDYTVCSLLPWRHTDLLEVRLKRVEDFSLKPFASFSIKVNIEG